MYIICIKEVELGLFANCIWLCVSIFKVVQLYSTTFIYCIEKSGIQIRSMNWANGIHFELSAHHSEVNAIGKTFIRVPKCSSEHLLVIKVLLSSSTQSESYYSDSTYNHVLH